MSNVFEGKPDARQSDDTKEAVSRFRPRYRALTPEEKDLHDRIKMQAVTLEGLFTLVKDGREKSIAFTKLEESIMWIIKGLTG